MMEEKPLISFIMPILNEEKTIKKCLDSILEIDYPKEKKEILLALGKSTDNTNKIIEQYKSKHPKLIKIFENPIGNTAIGRNICIDNATGDFLMNYSGHVIAEKNLLKVLVRKHKDTSDNVVSVGCANVSPEKQNFIAETASAVFSSFIGGKNVFVQNAEFTEERYTDHISFALYKKNPVGEVGMFDPEFWCGQDAELDLRLIQKGYKILFTPETKVYHFKRSTLKALFKQMYRYGIARAKMSKKHKKTIKPFHLIGTIFIFGILLVILLTLIQLIPIWTPLALALLYSIASMTSTASTSKKISSIAASPLFAFIIHCGYGLGFLRGILYSKL
jgi:glycosyltransferase involved in cell wall biosynthesis